MLVLQRDVGTPGTNCEVLAALDLEEWRVREKLTYEQLRDRLEFKSASQVRRYCLGEEPLKDERLERVLVVTQHEVGLYALHKRRTAWLRAHGMWSLSVVQPKKVSGGR